jgi:5'-deoxynucleotidase YfbR-like HD superfamily hydrolase
MKINKQPISALLEKGIEQISSCQVQISTTKKLSLLKDLKNTPRTGKLVRIKRYKLKVPCRSIYDHLISLAFNADLIFETLGIETDPKVFSSMILYHDLAESIMGDIPDFTVKKLAGKFYKKSTDKDMEEKLANQLIKNCFPLKIRKEFSTTLKLLDKETKIAKLFWFIDKTDPIIAIWRYIYMYKEEIDLEVFLMAMTDFFKNPRVLDFSLNKKTDTLIKFLQNKQSAKNYYQKGTSAFEVLKKSGLKINFLKQLVEGRVC